MSSIAVASVATDLHHLFTVEADLLGRTSGCIQRQRQFSGATLIQTLIGGWGADPDASLSGLTRLAASRGVASSPQALDQRFTPALLTFLAHLLSRVLTRVMGAAAPAAVPLLAHFSAVEVLDATTLSLPAALAAQFPGCGGQAGQGQAALKVGVSLDLVSGRLRLELVSGRTSDRRLALTRALVAPGSLQLRDLGFYRVADLAAIAQADAFFLTRWRANTALFDPDGTPWHDIGAVLAARAAAGVVDLPVLVGASERLPARLVAVPVPPAVAAQRRREKKRRAQRNGYTARQASLALCDWTLLLTNVAAAVLDADAVLVVARLRWQIEVLFRGWKGAGGWARSRSQQPLRVVAEVYAKLLGLVLQHWIIVVGGWLGGDRSLLKAQQAAREEVRALIQALDRASQVERVLRRLSRVLRQACRLHRRRDRPNAYQLLANPPVTGLP